MPLLIRIDVDRPYGKTPLPRHLLSRISSDLYFPRISAFGYLKELAMMLSWLNEASAPSYVFFRRCTLPSPQIVRLLMAGGHEIGLHLENSRSFATFAEERRITEKHVGRSIRTVSKHGSGGARFGFHHYAPYEPEKYIEWADRASMRLFLGNLEDPTIGPVTHNALTVFPSAFWLEPYWRDMQRFPIAWLVDEACRRDIVLLVHPENVLADEHLTQDFRMIIRSVPSKIL
jgi:hypothetical protein